MGYKGLQWAQNSFINGPKIVVLIVHKILSILFGGSNLKWKTSKVYFPLQAQYFGKFRFTNYWPKCSFTVRWLDSLIVLHESKVVYESATIGWMYSSCPENLLLSNWFARYFDHQNAYTGYPQFILPSFLRIIEEELCLCICVCFQSFIIPLRMGRLKPLKKN